MKITCIIMTVISVALCSLCLLDLTSAGDKKGIITYFLGIPAICSLGITIFLLWVKK
jgi:hypothetical protein